jgi:hypothetical protein
MQRVVNPASPGGLSQPLTSGTGPRDSSELFLEMGITRARGSSSGSSPGVARARGSSFTVPERPHAPGSLRNLAGSIYQEMTADMVVSRQSVGSLNATRTFATDFGKFIAFAQAILCLPRERHPKRLLVLQVLLAIHVLACVSTFLASFFEVGFGSVGKSKVHGEDDVMVILTSFDFLSQAVALLTGLLCAWWFFCTRHLMEATLAERPQRKSQGSTAAHSGALVGFGYDFFLSYPGAPPSGAKASDAAAAVLTRGASGAATLGGGSRCDAGHEVEELFSALDECCRKSNARYPTGCFLDWKKIPEQLATLAGKSQAKEGPNCPPGPRTGFHIFLSYRRKNAADARALKQALSLKGYRIFMDLDRDGLGAGDFQAQLEQVLDDVPVVIMHCSDQPPHPNHPDQGEFGRINEGGDWVRLEIRKTLQSKKLLIPVFSDGTDIGKLFSRLPDDCAALRKLNATPLLDGQYEASIDKVHGFIEDKAAELAETLLADQQEQTIVDHWVKHFWLHMQTSSVVVIVVTQGSLDCLRHPEKDRLGATKLLLEWSQALAMAEDATANAPPTSEQPASVVVVPLILCGHEGEDRMSSDGHPEERHLDFCNFDSVKALVDRLLGPETRGEASPSDAGGHLSRGRSSRFDSQLFWSEFSNETPKWAEGAAAGESGVISSPRRVGLQRASSLRASTALLGFSGEDGDEMSTRSVVQGIFRLARRNGIIANVSDRKIASMHTLSRHSQTDEIIYEGDNNPEFGNWSGPPKSVEMRTVIQTDEHVLHLVADELAKMQREVEDKQHIRFAQELQRPGRRLQTIYSLLLDEARERGGDEEVFRDTSYDILMREKAKKTELRPLTEAIASCNAQITRLRILWPLVAVFGFTWASLTVYDQNRYIDYLVTEVAAVDQSELQMQLPAGEVWCYRIFIFVETLCFVCLLFPLGVINYVQFKLDSKLTTALGRRFLSKLESPRASLPTDQLFHYEYDAVLAAADSLNFDWGFQLPLLLGVPTLASTSLWYRVWFQPCAFTMMPYEMCQEDQACSTFCDQTNQTTPSALSSNEAWYGLLPLVAIGTFVATFWPLMDFNGRFHVSLSTRIKSAIQACSHDQLSHLKDSGGRPVISSYVHRTAPVRFHF